MLVYPGYIKNVSKYGSVFWNVWDNFPDLSNTFFLKISNHIYQTSLRSLIWKHQKLRTITIDLYRNLCRGLGLHKSWGTPISICCEYLGLWKKRNDVWILKRCPNLQVFKCSLRHPVGCPTIMWWRHRGLLRVAVAAAPIFGLEFPVYLMI